MKQGQYLRKSLDFFWAIYRYLTFYLYFNDDKTIFALSKCLEMLYSLYFIAYKFML